MSIDLSNIVSHPVWVAVEEVLDEERDKRIRRLLSGTCTEPEYFSITGEIRGIELVLKTPHKRMQDK